MDKKKIKRATESKNMRIDHMRKKLKKYDEDEKKEARLKLKLCKYCYYVDDMIGGAAITYSKCENCDERIVNSSTNIDKYCNKCSEEHNICVHCGAEL